MKVISRTVRVYRLEVDEQEMAALERACDAAVRGLYGDEPASAGSITSQILAVIRAARVGEGE